MLKRILISTRRTSLLRTSAQPFLIRTIAPVYPQVCSIQAERSFSRYPRTTQEKIVAIATYEDVKAAGNSDKIYIIDVREPSELAETGKIPGSINIPLKTVEDTLKNMSPDEFKTKFGRDKPSQDTPIIFTCRSGRRSLEALKMAEGLGYTNLKNFDGGWLLWEQKEKH